MFKFPLFVTIFFGYAYAGLAPMIRQAYAGSGLTDEQIFEDLGKTAIIVEPKPFELNLDFDIEEQPKPFELNLDFDIEEILRSVRKKRSTAEVEVEKSKKTTEKPYYFCGGWCRRKRDAASVPERKTQTETATEKYTYSDFLYYSHLLLILFVYAFKNWIQIIRYISSNKRFSEWHLDWVYFSIK